MDQSSNTSSGAAAGSSEVHASRGTRRGGFSIPRCGPILGPQFAEVGFTLMWFWPCLVPDAISSLFQALVDLRGTGYVVRSTGYGVRRMVFGHKKNVCVFGLFWVLPFCSENVDPNPATTLNSLQTTPHNPEQLQTTPKNPKQPQTTLHNPTQLHTTQHNPKPQTLNPKP